MPKSKASVEFRNVGFGYKTTDAEKMVKKVAKADLSSEQLIREALKAAL